MDITYPGFGQIVVEGEKYDHDIVIQEGAVRVRDKKPSKPLKGRYGHTPLSADEDLPWSGTRLIIGSGYSGRLPVLPEIGDKAGELQVELVVVPTEKAVELLADLDRRDVNALLHVTC